MREGVANTSHADVLKLNEALRRSVPVTRMVDYGMDARDAQHIHETTAAGAGWISELCELASRDEEAGHKVGGDAALWHRAAVSLIVAQLAENFDTDRKRQLYRRMTENFERFALHAAMPIKKLEIAFEHGRLFGWHFRPQRPSRGAVIVFGGLSGWSTAYLSIAQALVREDLECILADGPGQGETRMEGRVFAGRHTVPGFARFIDHLEAETDHKRFGIWGNSFGGLFAARTAATDPRVGASCINGAPSDVQPPPFRTPAEQMAAIFGEQDLARCAEAMESLAFRPEDTPIHCPVLIFEGGADPLVPLGAQEVFLSRNTDPRSRKFTWPDGEHTIYNHAHERNELGASWFAECLTGR